MFTLAGEASNREQWSEAIMLRPKTGSLPTFEDVKVAIGGSCPRRELSVADGVTTEVGGDGTFTFTFTFTEEMMRQFSPGAYSLGIVLISAGIATQFGTGSLTIRDGVVA